MLAGLVIAVGGTRGVSENVEDFSLKDNYYSISLLSIDITYENL